MPDESVENSGASEPERKPSPGPEPERLKLPHEDWEEAVREALQDEASDENSSDGSEGERIERNSDGRSG